MMEARRVRKAPKVILTLLALGTLFLMLAQWSVAESSTDFAVACADNTGCRKLRVIGAIGGKHVRRINAGDMVVVVGKTKGGQAKVMKAVIVRLRKMQYSWLGNGFMTHFDQNAAVVVDANGDPVGSSIKGPIAKDAALRWPKIGAIARTIV